MRGLNVACHVMMGGASVVDKIKIYTELPTCNVRVATTNYYDLTSQITFSAHLCHLAEVQARSGTRQNIWVMAPLQPRPTQVTGLRVAPWQCWVQVSPGGGRCAAG